MPTFGNYPDKYLLYNQQKSKNLALVFQIEGIDQLFGVSRTYTVIRYGDPGLFYGLPDLVYGGLRLVGGAHGAGGVKPYIIFDQGLTISQRIEPEQGKGNVGAIQISMIDKNGEISKLIAPGITVDEVLLNRQVTLYLGYRQSSFPEDYLIIYRGYITSLDCPPGAVVFQISDSTTRTRQAICDVPTTKTTDIVDASTGDIPVLTTASLYKQIIGPDGTYDPIVATFIKVEDEIMQYGATGIINGTDILVTRGSYGTTPASHAADSDVSNSIELGHNVEGENFVTLALKLLLSGWAGPCEQNVEVLSFVWTYNLDLGFVNNVFVLKTQDAKRDLGLTVGDYFTISGSSHPSNNVSGKITQISILNSFNRLIYTDKTFTLENPSSAVVAFRSKYDTLPVTAGAKCRMRDVDVEGMENIRSNYFDAGIFNVRLYLDAAVFAKDVIDTELMLPMGSYGISRYGRISMSVAKPPLPGIGKLVQLDWTNVLDPDKIHVTRATNSRNFFNQVSYEYDFNPVDGTFGTIQYFLDTDSATLFNQTATLPITTKAIHTDLGGADVAQIRGGQLLNRYKKVAVMIELTVNWSVGSLIELSDIVLLVDEGKLKIMNFETGQRNLRSQLFEVVDRELNIGQGTAKLKLLSGVGFSFYSRFGLYSPSSKIAAGSTSTRLKLKPSFGQTDVFSEIQKWTQFFGYKIQVHDYAYTVNEKVTMVSVDPADSTALLVDPPLSFTPPEDYIIDIDTYNVNPDEESKYKTLYEYFTPSIPVTSGVSTTQFHVSLSDVSKLTIGNTVILRNTDYSVVSPEIAILSIVGTLVTLASALTFTPDSTYTVEGIGFTDGTSFYRWG